MIREITIYKGIDDFNLRVLRNDMQVFEFTLGDVKPGIEDSVKALIDFAQSLKTQKEEAAIEAARYLAETAPIEKQLELISLFPEWAVGVDYKQDQRIQHDGILYRVIQNHRAQSDWLPQNTPALFQRLSPVDQVDEMQEWKQPEGAHDAYKKGDRVKFMGKIYRSLINANTFSPTDYPAGWELVEE